MNENEQIEFKENYTENIYKEIIWYLEIVVYLLKLLFQVIKI